MISDIIDAKAGGNDAHEAILNKKGWIFPPVVLEEDQSGSLFIVDGHKRIGAALLVGIDTVPALVVSQDKLNEFLAQ